jgi:uncharacterized protein YbcI
MGDDFSHDGPRGALVENGEVPYSLTADISRHMVGLYKEQFGRGPVKVRTDWAGENMLVCTLEDSMTPAEKNLRAMGEHQRLRDIRMFFQYAQVKEFVEPVERITGRTVRSFISGMDTEADTAMEAFVFYPRGSEGPSRAEAADA